VLFREPEANRIVELHIVQLARFLEKTIQPEADVLAFLGSIDSGADDAVRDAIEARSAKQKKRDGLSVLLQTTGGYIEVAQRIADTLRHHYPKRVEFIVPNYAMSAGTVLVMSGDDIQMDYYSVLGPIDPQVERVGTGRFVPALGYLEKFNELVEKSRQGTLTDAELTFLVERFDPAELHQFEQARELSKTLLRDWLASYKFKDWKQTETRKRPVTPQMRQERATEIAAKLNDTKKWHVHGRGISRAVLERELNLKTGDFGANPKLATAIRGYYKALVDYGDVLGLTDSSLAVHTTQGYHVAYFK